jgi:hypothetical protein
MALRWGETNVALAFSIRSSTLTNIIESEEKQLSVN